MLDAFYGAFSPACFALLGLWLVVVQMRMGEWEGSPAHRRRSYGVALHFALPGVMSMFALIDSQDPAFWRVSFAIVALGGAIVMALVRGHIVAPEPDASTGADASAGGAEAGSQAEASRGKGRGLPAADQLGAVAYVTAIVLYVLIGALALVGGLAVLRTEASLLTVLVFLGFNAAWLLLFDDRNIARPAVKGS